jgi:NAD(P)-dependent dehydrogenase (short-subunit alcohol dehydrogenase family)
MAECGARVAVVDLSRPRAGATVAVIESAGGVAMPVEADVTAGEDCMRAAETAAERFGPVTVLVNNLGAAVPGSVTEVDEDSWNRALALNLTSVMLMSRAVVPQMAAAAGGSIVNVSSISSAARIRARRSLCGSQGRGELADLGDGGGPRPAGHPGELHCARAPAHADRCAGRGGDARPATARRAARHRGATPSTSPGRRCSSPPTSPATSPLRCSRSTLAPPRSCRWPYGRTWRRISLLIMLNVVRLETEMGRLDGKVAGITGAASLLAH